METTYTIKELSEIIGVKAHTIRSWERRYGITCPERNCHNARTYSGDDVRTLTQIALLTKNGIRISKISEMSESEIADHVSRLRAKNGDAAELIDAMSLALMDYDACKIECMLSSHIRHKGVEETVETVIFPLMDKLGILYLSGSMNSTHGKLLREVTEQKLRRAIDELPRVAASGNRMLLFVTKPQQMNIAALYIQYQARKSNWCVIPFHSEMSPEELLEMIGRTSPQLVVALHGEAGRASLLEAASLGISEQEDSTLIIYSTAFSGNLIDSTPHITILDDLHDTLELIQIHSD